MGMQGTATPPVPWDVPWYPGTSTHVRTSARACSAFSTALSSSDTWAAAAAWPRSSSATRALNAATCCSAAAAAATASASWALRLSASWARAGGGTGSAGSGSTQAWVRAPSISTWAACSCSASCCERRWASSATDSALRACSQSVMSSTSRIDGMHLPPLPHELCTRKCNLITNAERALRRLAASSACVISS